MKKVLVISGSPRKNGNSEILCDEFAKGAIASGNKVEKIILKYKRMNYCAACDYCVSHNGECAFQDDISDILDKMIEVDVIVMASPVYFYSIDAQLKTLIDRCVARYTEMKGKELYFILTAAEKSEEAFEGSLACLRGFRDCLDGAVEKGYILGGGAWKVGEIKSTDAFIEAFKMGKGV